MSVSLTTWNDKQLETYEMLIYGIVSLIIFESYLSMSN